MLTLLNSISGRKRDSDEMVELDTEECQGTLEKCCAQEQCPLFMMLPREIRNMIWEYATAPEEDWERRHNREAYYYRPDREACLKTNYNLLLTCRRVWLEAHALPMLQAEPCCWYHRPAPDACKLGWLDKLTPQNRRNLGHVRLYAQMYAIEPLKLLGTADLGSKNLVEHFRMSQNPSSGIRFQPRILHVIIRHTDWWYWEQDEPLRLDHDWVRYLLNSEELRSTHIIKLELETLDYKVSQLQPIVERLSALTSDELETHKIGDKPVKTRFALSGSPKSTTWNGPTNINKERFRAYQGKNVLKYHIVTIQWKLQFPNIPSAHVPTLRLAPRINVKTPHGQEGSGEMARHMRSTRSNRKRLRLFA